MKYLFLFLFILVFLAGCFSETNNIKDHSDCKKSSLRAGYWPWPPEDCLNENGCCYVELGKVTAEKDNAYRAVECGNKCRSLDLCFNEDKITGTYRIGSGMCFCICRNNN